MEAELNFVFQVLSAGSLLAILLVLFENLLIFRNPGWERVLCWNNFEADLFPNTVSENAQTRGALSGIFWFLFSDSMLQALHLAGIFLQLQGLWLVFTGSYWGLLPILAFNLFVHVWLRIRFLGPFCGGADAMMFQLSVVSFLLELLKCLGEKYFYDWAPVAVIYLGVQVGLSYFLAGITRLREGDWISGVALSRLLRSSAYGIRPSIQVVSDSRVVFAGFSISVIVFEMMSPVAVFSQQLLSAYVVLALVFHLFNAWVLGLNRFVWAWSFSLPAFWYLGKFLQNI